MNMSNSKKPDTKDLYDRTIKEFEDLSKSTKEQLKYLQDYRNGKITMQELLELCKTSLQLK